MKRHHILLLAAILFLSLSFVSCYLGPGYELHKLSDDAQLVLHQSGEDITLALKWIGLGFFFCVLGAFSTAYGVNGWIQHRERSKKYTVNRR